MPSQIVYEFSETLRKNLLVDNYGGWEELLGKQNFQDLCDRVAQEAELFIEKNLKEITEKNNTLKSRLAETKEQRDILVNGMTDLINKVKL